MCFLIPEIIVLLVRLLPTTKKLDTHTNNGFKRELATGKISELYKWSRNTPGDTQSVKTRKKILLAMLIRSQLILAKLGVSSNGENPVVGCFFCCKAKKVI